MKKLDAFTTLTREGASTLKEEIAISLFTNQRDKLGKEHGWWGYCLSDAPPFGSKLWQLDCEKLTNETLEKASMLAKESLSWILEEDWAQEMKVEAHTIPYGLELTIEILFPNTTTTYTFEVK